MTTWLKDKYNQNILLNYIFRVFAIVLSLFTVKINISYLGNTLYGLWLTIASVISWMSSGDLGIGNGLRNELAKAYGENDKEKQKKLIATGIITLSKLAMVLLVIIFVLCEVFFGTNILDDTVRIPMYITAVFFCINLCLSVSQSIAFSYQKSWLASMVACFISGLSIAVVLLLTLFDVQANLSVFAVVNGISTTIPNFVLIFILKRDGISFFDRHSKQNYDIDVRKSIMNMGMQFFCLQLCAVVLYSTDNLIINYLLDSEMVTKYSVITKIYETGSNLFSILLVALWSAVTMHIAQNNYQWIRNKLKELLKFWLVFAVGVVAVSFLFNYIVMIWLGEEAYYYEMSLVVLFALYCLTTTFSAIFVNILNGAGIIRLQLIIAIIGAVLNIPLSVLFATTCGMGILGIKLATYISALMTAVALPIQAVLFLKRKEKESVKTVID